MKQQITVFGYGAVGQPIVERLLARGDRVRVATRRLPANLPADVEHMPCDVLDAADVRAALAGARGPDDAGAPTLRCAICHHAANFASSGVPGNPEWKLAPIEMAWAGKTLGEICRQILGRQRCRKTFHARDRAPVSPDRRRADRCRARRFRHEG